MIEQEIAKILLGHFDEGRIHSTNAARDLAGRMERSWTEAHNEGCVGSERRGPIEDFGELDPIIAAHILAACRGDET